MLPNRSAGDVGCEIFSYLYQFAAVCLDTMGWQLRLGRMGELIKVEGAGIWIRKSKHYYTFLNTYLILLQVHSFESGYSSLTQPQDLQRKDE